MIRDENQTPMEYLFPNQSQYLLFICASKMGGWGRMAARAGAGALRGSGLGQGRELIFYDWKIADFSVEQCWCLLPVGAQLYLTLDASLK